MNIKTGFFKSISETGENIYPFVFISSFVFCGVSICVQCFSDIMRNQTWYEIISTRVKQKKIKSSWNDYVP